MLSVDTSVTSRASARLLSVTVACLALVACGGETSSDPDALQTKDKDNGTLNGRIGTVAVVLRTASMSLRRTASTRLAIFRSVTQRSAELALVPRLVNLPKMGVASSEHSARLTGVFPCPFQASHLDCSARAWDSCFRLLAAAGARPKRGVTLRSRRRCPAQHLRPACPKR